MHKNDTKIQILSNSKSNSRKTPSNSQNKRNNSIKHKKSLVRKGLQGKFLKKNSMIISEKSRSPNISYRNSNRTFKKEVSFKYYPNVSNKENLRNYENRVPRLAVTNDNSDCRISESYLSSKMNQNMSSSSVYKKEPNSVIIGKILNSKEKPLKRHNDISGIEKTVDHLKNNNIEKFQVTRIPDYKEIQRPLR